MNKEQELATRFTRILREWLTPEQLDEVNKRNIAYMVNGEPFCATHEFCDPNQAMSDALEEMGIELDTRSEAQCDLINAAWKIAKKLGFPANIEEVFRKRNISVE